MGQVTAARAYRWGFEAGRYAHRQTTPPANVERAGFADEWEDGYEDGVDEARRLGPPIEVLMPGYHLRPDGTLSKMFIADKRW